jgi:hypothetical protein
MEEDRKILSTTVAPEKEPKTKSESTAQNVQDNETETVV